MRLGERLSALAPATYRGRIALAIVATLVIAVIGVQLVLDVFVGQRVQRAVEGNLQQQATELVRVAQRSGYPGVARASGLLPGTSVQVLQGGTVLFWNGPVKVLDAQATAEAGDIQVILQREADAGVLGEWAVPLTVIAFIMAIGGMGWWLAGLASRRLRREATALATQAEAVAAGDLEARVEVQDDELVRVATSLNTMTERLADADRRQRLFLADVAHELRTPVTAIDGFAQAMVDGTIRTDESRLEAAEIIHEESQRLARLVADLQALTLTALDAEPVRDATDVVDLARDATARLEAAAAERGVLLRGPDVTQNAVMVATDPTQVETILGNLITNALRATPPGGTIRVAVSTAGDEAVVSVTDTGVGIAAEHLPHIFDRMYRVDAARDRDSGGTGLGLAIVAALAELLGARLEVESEPGTGSRFALHLPTGRT